MLVDSHKRTNQSFHPPFVWIKASIDTALEALDWSLHFWGNISVCGQYEKRSNLQCEKSVVEEVEYSAFFTCNFNLFKLLCRFSGISTSVKMMTETKLFQKGKSVPLCNKYRQKSGFSSVKTQQYLIFFHKISYLS